MSDNHHVDNMCCVYGPLSEIEMLRTNLLDKFNQLHDAILEEKFLGGNIKINVLPTPYRAVSLNSIHYINNFKEKLCFADSAQDITEIENDFDHFKTILQLKLDEAFVKTQSLIATLQSTINVDNIKEKLKTAIKNNLKRVIDLRQECKLSGDGLVSSIDVSFNFAKKLKIAVAERQQKIVIANQKNELEKELHFISECFMEGNSECLKSHFFFRTRHHYLRLYYAADNSLSKNIFKIMLQSCIKKILNNFNSQTDLEKIYMDYMNYLEELEQKSMKYFSNGQFSEEKAVIFKKQIEKLQKKRSKEHKKSSDVISKEKFRRYFNKIKSDLMSKTDISHDDDSEYFYHKMA